MKYIAKRTSASGVFFITAGLLWTGALRYWLPLVTESTIFPETWLDFKLMMPLQLLFPSISSAMLVVMSVEKCFALYFPLKAKYLCTIEKAKRVTLATVVVTLLYNIQYCFSLSSDVIMGQHVGCKFAFKIERLLRNVIFFVIPAVVMVICNSAIGIKLFLKRYIGYAEQNEKTARQATIMLLCVTGLFIFSTFPLPIFLLVTKSETIRNMGFITVILFMFNHSMNVLFYMLSGSKYREGVRKMFRFKKNRVGVVTDTATVDEQHVNNPTVSCRHGESSRNTLAV